MDLHLGTEFPGWGGAIGPRASGEGTLESRPPAPPSPFRIGERGAEEGDSVPVHARQDDCHPGRASLRCVGDNSLESATQSTARRQHPCPMWEEMDCMQ